MKGSERGKIRERMKAGKERKSKENWKIEFSPLVSVKDPYLFAAT